MTAETGPTTNHQNASGASSSLPWPLAYRHDQLHLGAVSLQEVAQRVSTPSFIYSRQGIERRYRAIDQALAATKHQVCYAVKANSNLAVLDVLARLGSGFDIVSVGELERVLVAGGEAAKVVFSGVGKRRDEMRRALEVGVRCFNVESSQELDVLAALANDMRSRAPVSLRVNPDVDARTHPYISTGLKRNKFGVPIDEARVLYRRAASLPSLKVVGVDCHIGSQLGDSAPMLDAMHRVLAMVDALAGDGIELEHIDMGGGYGVAYSGEAMVSPAHVMSALVQALGARKLELLVEPGRAVVAESGVLVTRVLYTKQNGDKSFVIVDAAMNDLIRPALYQGVHPVWPVVCPASGAVASDRPQVSVDVVGPVCESGDFLALDRTLAVEPGDLLAIGFAGAYGFAMSSNYNSRPRAAEVMVDDKQWHVVRQREQVSELYQHECRLPG